MSKIATNLYEDGTLVHVSVSNWSGKMTVTPEDLGYTKEEYPEIYELGKKYIYPKGRLKILQSNGQATYMMLRRMSFGFPVGNGIHYMDNQTLEIFTKKFEEKKEGREEQVALMMKDFDENKERHMDKIKEAAEQAFTRMNGAAKGTVGEFVQTILDRVEAAYPKKEELWTKFDMTMTTFEINAEGNPVVSGAIEKFVQNEVIPTLRGKVVEVCNHVKEQIKNKEAVRKDTFDSLNKAFAEFKRMNFVGDEDTDALIEEVRVKYLNGDHEAVQGDMVKGLGDALGAMTATIKKMDDKSIAKVMNGYKKRKIKL